MPDNAPPNPPNPPASNAPAAPPPRVPVARARRRVFSPVWIIPLVAAGLGAWLVARYYASKGPEITVRFETAEGIIAGKTPILCRSVNIGTVSEVRLTEDIKAVRVKLDMSSDATRLLTKDTQIWVVRARYSSAGISGLNTIVSGNYLELQPGLSKEARRDFVGLENPPVTPPGVPGLRLKLTAEEAGGIGPGASIIYKGTNVGKVETKVFHPESGETEFGVFIENPFGNLVDGKTRFYNSSGIDLKVGADGLKLRSGTLESILAGGITFNEPEEKDLSKRHVANGTSFTLYASYDEANKVTELNPTVPYLLLFNQSVRGLNPDAPVEFRGIRVGTVMGVSLKYLPNDPEQRIPVLIKLDPGTFLDLPNPTDLTAAQAVIAQNVEKGLRASMKTGNLLTGQMFIDLDFVKDAPKAEIASVSGYQVMPTTAGGLGQLQEKLTALLDKIQALPLEQTVTNASDTLASLKTTVNSLNVILADEKTKALPGELQKDLAELQKTLAGYNGSSPFYQDLSGTLRQLTETLRSLKTLTGTLERSPNSIIFGKPGGVAPPRGTR